VTFDLVVHGVGRVPNLVGLDLDAANVESGPRGIRVDGYLRSTSNPRVLAAGDCADSGAPPLTPVASAHADCIAHNWIAGEDRSRPDVEGIARVVFTVPPLAAVGLTEERARRAGLELDVRAGEHADWNATRKVGQRCAAYKLIVDAQSDRLLGAHVLGPRADELANLFTLALRKRCTATELASTPFAFPTFGHDVRSMF
jgi:glutathione reductase (NADPH)